MSDEFAGPRPSYLQTRIGGRMGIDGGPLSFAGARVGPGFRRVVVVLAPGGRHPYDTTEWSGALVVVEHGEVEMERHAGAPVRFRSGAVLFLDGLALRALHNRGAEPAVLIAVTRAPVPPARPPAGCAPGHRRAAALPNGPPPGARSPATG